jgi:hypothetical protein
MPIILAAWVLLPSTLLVMVFIVRGRIRLNVMTGIVFSIKWKWGFWGRIGSAVQIDLSAFYFEAVPVVFRYIVQASRGCIFFP